MAGVSPGEWWQINLLAGEGFEGEKSEMKSEGKAVMTPLPHSQNK